MRLRRIVAVVLVLGAGAAGCGTGGPEPEPTRTPAAIVTSIQNDAALKTKLEAFITQRGVDQGRAAGAAWITSGLQAVAKNGTEYALLVDYADSLIGVGVVQQLAYLVGKFDGAATKVTVRTAGGLVVYNGKPPAEPMIT